MSKLVIFCDNYTQIFHTLYVVTHNRYDQITIVITQYGSLFKFFRVINERVFHNEINLVYIEPYQPRMAKARGINKIWYVLVNIMKQRHYLKGIFDKHFAGLEECEVIFGPGYTGLECFLLKKLSRRNRLVYVSPGPPSYMRKYTPTNLVDWLILMTFKLTYGRAISMGQVSQFPLVKGFPYLSDKFIAKEVNRVVTWEEVNEMMKGFDLSQFKIFDVGNYKVIYFHDDIIEAPYSSIDEESANRELAQIFGVLTNHFPQEEIATKFTPANPPKPRIKVGDILPAFVPAELLYKDSVKMYLSVFSASIANVERGVAVSMADLITFKSYEIKEQLRQGLLQRSKSKILFPKSLDEFEQIVIDLKQQSE